MEKGVEWYGNSYNGNGGLEGFFFPQISLFNGETRARLNVDGTNTVERKRMITEMKERELK